ncbi:hypothetical protein EUGRSUZ_J00089 [Eucalyptus grandis]|uniref:Uncharacterized protein n=4 Tax=Eucalyptus grandis TaxID=71139 RepID=A0A059A993_EUCGR|nr:hypothetical protein EUGRSUZ_J00089 [Eucalyptus grandis]KAK3407689.1 hypothetical protein EUGRSUZ_J00089 [Eucalyptus grandis]KAK3407690.1 hypothetical protein EUGRSUZ_J00089 [Eucalyptus grandis]
MPELNKIKEGILMRLRPHESLSQQLKPNRKSKRKSKELEKLKIFEAMLDRVIAMLQVNKADIEPTFKGKLVQYDEHLMNFINTSRPRNVPRQQGQLPPPHMHSG